MNSNIGEALNRDRLINGLKVIFAHIIFFVIWLISYLIFQNYLLEHLKSLPKINAWRFTFLSEIYALLTIIPVVFYIVDDIRTIRNSDQHDSSKSVKSEVDSTTDDTKHNNLKENQDKRLPLELVNSIYLERLFTVLSVIMITISLIMTIILIVENPIFGLGVFAVVMSLMANATVSWRQILLQKSVNIGYQSIYIQYWGNSMKNWKRWYLLIFIFSLLNLMISFALISQVQQISLFENIKWNDVVQDSIPILIPYLCVLLIIVLVSAILRIDLRNSLANLRKLSIFGTEFEFNDEIKQQLQLAINTYEGSLNIKEREFKKVLEEAKYVREDLKGARILWVDQNPLGNANIHRFLNELGVIIDNTDSNEEVLAAMRWSSKAYEVIITNMRHRDKKGDYHDNAGDELLKLIKNYPKDSPDKDELNKDETPQQRKEREERIDRVKNKSKDIILFIAAKPDPTRKGFETVTDRVDILLLKIFEIIKNESIERKLQ